LAGEELSAIRSAPPDFMHSNPHDPLWKQFRQRQAIFTHGELVWGQIVQGNSTLYEDGTHDAPAAYIYSLDPEFDDDVITLAEIADTLYELRGETTDSPETQRFADMLGDGYQRELLAQVPYSVTDGRDVYYSCGIIPRKYLPTPRIAMPLFPLVIVPGKTEATWMLPSRWWPTDLIEMWIDALEE
jgi:hypothetical protein